MFLLCMLAGLACFIAACAFFNHYCLILLPQKKQPLYIVLQGEIPHVEAILLELYAFLQRKQWFEPKFINLCRGESRVIAEKFCLSHALPCADTMPRAYAKSLRVGAASDIAGLKRELALLRTEIEINKTGAQRDA